MLVGNGCVGTGCEAPLPCGVGVLVGSACVGVAVGFCPWAGVLVGARGVFVGGTGVFVRVGVAVGPAPPPPVPSFVAPKVVAQYQPYWLPDLKYRAMPICW